MYRLSLSIWFVINLIIINYYFVNSEEAVPLQHKYRTLLGNERSYSVDTTADGNMIAVEMTESACNFLSMKYQLTFNG